MKCKMRERKSEPGVPIASVAYALKPFQPS